jgi:hypothetical protein
MQYGQGAKTRITIATAISVMKPKGDIVHVLCHPGLCESTRRNVETRKYAEKAKADPAITMRMIVGSMLAF